MTACAVGAFAPDLETFESGRNFAAWVSYPASGPREARSIVGGMSVIRRAVRKGGNQNRWQRPDTRSIERLPKIEDFAAKTGASTRALGLQDAIC